MPYVSIFGWTILALSLANDHLDFLEYHGDELFRLTKSFTVTKSEPEMDSLHIFSINSELGLVHWITRNFRSVPTL